MRRCLPEIVFALLVFTFILDENKFQVCLLGNMQMEGHPPAAMALHYTELVNTPFNNMLNATGAPSK